MTSTLRDKATTIVANAARKALADPAVTDAVMHYIADQILRDSLADILALLVAEVDMPGAEDALHPGAVYYRKMRAEGAQALSEVWAAS
jgi:hypothetical protein